MKLDFSQETLSVVVVITHVMLLLQGAAETHCGASVVFFAVFVVFK